MPTPNDGDPLLQATVTLVERPVHSTCPPDRERPEEWHIRDDQTPSRPTSASQRVPREVDELVESVEESQTRAESDQDMESIIDQRSKGNTVEQEQDAVDMSTPSAMSDSTDARMSEPPTSSSFTQSTNPSTGSSSSTSFATSNVRIRPRNTSSFLRVGSKFEGTQQSDKQRYKVEVEIKHVDMDESFLCGYLRIEGLTEEHLVLTTYFEGEIIGPKYTFLTKHQSWGATDKTDMHHWNRFPAWRPLANQAKKPDFHYKNFAQKENIFMRWKECFLVPDHRITTISGASFEGFYYICFNQVAGTVSGIYFHGNSEKYQQLELKHVPNRGCLPAVEFR